MISTREAARHLHGIGLTRRQTDRLLGAGFAGEPLRTAGAMLWHEGRVHELASRPWVEETGLDEVCPQGLFVARRHVDLRAPATDQLAAVRGDWDLSLLTRVFVKHAVGQHGLLPFVATVTGFVALGAEIVDVTTTVRTTRATTGSPRQVTTLDLERPGAWFEHLRGRRLPSGPGRPWVIRGWQPFTERTRRGLPTPLAERDVGGSGT